MIPEMSIFNTMRILMGLAMQSIHSTTSHLSEQIRTEQSQRRQQLLNQSQLQNLLAEVDADHLAKIWRIDKERAR